MAELEQVTDHTEQAYSLFLDQYLEKPRLFALLASYTDEIQELEDAIWGVRIGRFLDSAEGAQLDVIGKLVGEPRNDRPDNVYKILIAGKIRVNWSHGHPDDVIAVVRLVQGAENTHRYYDVYPASLEIDFQDDFVETDRGFTAPELELVIADLVRRARPAGVHSTVLAINEGGTALKLELDDDVDVTGDEGLGLDDDVDDGGGLLAGGYS